MMCLSERELMKKCFKCGQILALGSFYRHKEMADGRLKKCKECHKAEATKNRWENIERIRAYDRMRGVRNNPNSYRTKERVRCMNAVNKALRAGKIERWHCQVCGAAPTHGHHVSYAKGMELAVTWLCPVHHKQVHMEET